MKTKSRTNIGKTISEQQSEPSGRRKREKSQITTTTTTKKQEIKISASGGVNKIPPRLETIQAFQQKNYPATNPVAPAQV